MNSQIRVDIGGGNVITSMKTTDAVAALDVAAGDAPHVIIKASRAMPASG